MLGDGVVRGQVLWGGVLWALCVSVWVAVRLIGIASYTLVELCANVTPVVYGNVWDWC